MLDTGRYDDHGGTTKLDRHRVNLCRKEIESILERIKINGELPSNRYTRIAMAHAYQYLKTVKKLREDVSRLSCQLHTRASLFSVFLFFTRNVIARRGESCAAHNKVVDPSRARIDE